MKCRQERTGADLSVFGTIDDSKVISKGYERILLPMLSADLGKSIVCCPRTREEVAQFMDRVCPSDMSGHVDAVILDQNIDLQQSDVVLGTDLALGLRFRNFAGLVIIRSANAMEKNSHLSSLGEDPVDLWLDKESSNQSIVSPILEALAEKSRRDFGSMCCSDEASGSSTSLGYSSTGVELSAVVPSRSPLSTLHNRR